LFDGDLGASAPQMIGLIDVQTLVTTIAASQGAAPDLAPRLQATRTLLASALQSAGNAQKAGVEATSSVVGVEALENASSGSGTLEGRSVTRARTPASSSNSSSLAAAAAGV
jgi:hypothetical protein